MSRSRRGEHLFKTQNSFCRPHLRQQSVRSSQPFVQAIFDFETPRMANGRLALLGDAAFVVRPHTAMGVAKAAGDAIALRRLLSSSSLVAALQSYDIERSKVGTTIAAYGRRLGATLG